MRGAGRTHPARRRKPSICARSLPEITSRRFDTNDISRAFLDCSVQHHFSLAVNSLTDLPSADRILNVFSAIGHSSGIDTLCGVAYGLSAEV
ncbi:MAG: DUF2877 domain-containing protein [Enterocloster bolteae]